MPRTRSWPGQYPANDRGARWAPKGCNPPKASTTKPPAPLRSSAIPRAMSQPGQYAEPVITGTAPNRWRPPYPSRVYPPPSGAATMPRTRPRGTPDDATGGLDTAPTTPPADVAYAGAERLKTRGRRRYRHRADGDPGRSVPGPVPGAGAHRVTVAGEAENHSPSRHGLAWRTARTAAGHEPSVGARILPYLDVDPDDAGFRVGGRHGHLHAGRSRGRTGGRSRYRRGSASS